MNQYKSLLSRCLCWGMIGLIGLVVVGCKTNPVDYIHERLGQQGDTRMDDVLRRNIIATGGEDNWDWSNYLGIQGNAINTIVGADSEKNLIEQHHVIIPGERIAIEVYSKEADGILKEWIDKRGKTLAVFQGNADQTSIDPGKIDQYAAALRLKLISHALTGAIGLLQKDYALRYMGQERKGGRLMHKIEAVGPFVHPDQFDNRTTGNLMVAWIDAETYLFETLWLRYHLDAEQFGYLAVNITDYEETLEGLVLPRLLEFVRSDEHQQFGHLLMMSLEYQDFEVVTPVK
ncbi:MAG: hypothetical protein GY869_18430 [Planctomycetes bacterium]|nr:hypothetical protein [Planctomycetota bacterium]